ncbi:phosphohydrolase [Pseudogulbenkiania ferrooxidans]|uniref:Metal dependent phosphohydrolase n=1 Tax=Pseudogulbenkiania ferrooxidans 2002 TaxID=279714 RepID=B9Z4W4_9NEIS|nr:phosphohydrolase [Pseudogulbenkiania ferrooxidans]EEG08196.1 metal dependent phosphohydrolase [Pseudogulbenkiania ferrooxidans 2002]
MTTAHIQTVSGRYVDLLHPNAADIEIRDIAHHLAHLCRFGGAVREFYSVAEHSLRVAQILPPALRLAGLLHDAAEAYVGDVISPLKRNLASYQYVEELVHDAVRSRFGLKLSGADRATVTRADIVLLATERRDLMPADSTEWAVLVGVAPLPERIRPMPAEAARAAFLRAFEEFAQLDLLGA